MPQFFTVVLAMPKRGVGRVIIWYVASVTLLCSPILTLKLHCIRCRSSSKDAQQSEDKLLGALFSDGLAELPWSQATLKHIANIPLERLYLVCPLFTESLAQSISARNAMLTTRTICSTALPSINHLFLGPHSVWVRGST